MEPFTGVAFLTLSNIGEVASTRARISSNVWRGASLSTVLPAVATTEICAALYLPAGAAVFRVEQLIEAGGQPAGWHRVHVRPERYRCVVRWDPSASG